MALDQAKITQSELDAAFYGVSTAKAVLSYKNKRNIVNRAYESQADDIVGIMTIKAMDAELLSRQVQPRPRPTYFCYRGCTCEHLGGKVALCETFSSLAQQTPRSEIVAAQAAFKAA